MITSTDKTYQQWHEFECRAAFHSVEEARAAGIGIGFVFQGAPLKLDGNYNSQGREQWRTDNCHKLDTSIDYERAFTTVQSMGQQTNQAWLECIKVRYPSVGLRCDLTGDRNRAWLSVGYWPPDDFASAVAPTLKSLDV